MALGRNGADIALNGEGLGTGIFPNRDLKKLHLQLKHGSHTAMKDWIKAIGKWSDDLDEGIANVLFECKCKTAHSPSPHAVVSTRLPSKEKQTDVAVDLIFLEGVPCPHVIDKCTGWSETTTLRRRVMDGDREYRAAKFAAMCEEISANLILLAANDHEANGAVEGGNRTLRNFFSRLRAEESKSTVAAILAEATTFINRARKNCESTVIILIIDLQSIASVEASFSLLIGSMCATRMSSLLQVPEF